MCKVLQGMQRRMGSGDPLLPSYHISHNSLQGNRPIVSFIWFGLCLVHNLLWRNFSKLNSSIKFSSPRILLMAASAWGYLSLRKSQIRDSGINVATMTIVRSATAAIASMLKRQKWWTAPRKDIVEPPRAYMKAKTAAAIPWLVTFVSSKRNT